MAVSGQLATVEDLVAWTMPTTGMAPGISSLVSNLANGICQSLSAQFCIDAQVRDIAIPRQLFARRMATAGRDLVVDLKCLDSGDIVSIAINTQGWNSLVCEFFGGMPEGEAVGGEASPVEKAMRDKIIERLRRNIASAMGEYGFGVWALAEEADAPPPDEALSIGFSIVSPTQSVRCSVDMPPAFVRRIWNELSSGGTEQNHAFTPRGALDMTLTAELPFDGVSMDRILNHADGEAMVFGDAAKQKVRLLCNGVMACEGVLTERNGRYAIEITAVG